MAGLTISMSLSLLIFKQDSMTFLVQMNYIFLFIKMGYNMEFQLLCNEVVPEDKRHEGFEAKEKES